eukprot:1606554-Alexandrium_andersonii.AAC.1
MSASLVGSEMCIRDSLATAAERAASMAGGGVAALARQAIEDIAGGAREAVSYTHLTLPTICSV